MELIKKDLNEFQLGMNQLLSVTTDNGRNSLKAVADVDAEYQSTKYSDGVSDASCNDSDFDIDSDELDEDYYMDLLSSMRSQFNSSLYIDLIHGMSCGAHMLQLVVNHGLDKCEEAKITIELARKLIIPLRTPTFKNCFDQII